ncbi:MAG: hypothetical protein IPJ68_00265 [Candidatus Moraniibacteriota bacterium]|nr:MAG: hypothetical protein IPJ68_00265 [Candidatus Moranbacteria bacterium]
MSKKPVREDVYMLFFAAKLYVIVVGAFIFAVGLDIYHTVEAIEKMYGS